MNDPNGMVFLNGKYHLFFQHNPDSTVWGPMHWGHATSTDLVHWQELPIALYPDSLGTIFSGSAVIDENNTAGFGKNAMVAIYTNHSHELEKTNVDTFQTQSIAYSLDEGKTWTKYSGNPVIRNPGIHDFRDPKVYWFDADKKWIMTLATLDHITFYSSPDLKNWKEESKFGKNIGAHGGVWECPDLFPMDYNGKQIWTLIVNINPGGPNGGSATQYFTGNFDGHNFTPFDTATRWLDYGPDEYAGITWSNTGNRRIFLGWMSNWQYANVVPTEKWRSATTIARELSLENVNGSYLVTSVPVKELDKVVKKQTVLSNIDAKNYTLTDDLIKLNGAARLSFSSNKIKSFDIILSNEKGEKVVVGYSRTNKKYFIDRTKSGNISFEKGFAQKHTAPRFSTSDTMNITLVIDKASVELFADNGLTVMTEIFFPTTPFSIITIQSPEGMMIQELKFDELSGK
ncbi:glycoside hydrolase family 32 protein [Niabella ginsengisoli]|uniref:Glycoside hydrolase family 32 protein n=1 Tax=Niabella ginsengisoli TaxID=522298 RepID=A0ABS9SR71_9BACT|nr:glycoside hydrolase family 32 protein [Niabella ginsengisoli]MCH5600871.1 glycoside hydrolase family 32 protein [Niabella ginsengisoli]